MSSRLITIALTQGDPAGIGPEIVVEALRRWPRPPDCRLIAVGYPEHFFPAPEDRRPDFIEAEQLMSLSPEPQTVWLRPPDSSLDHPVERGRSSTASARAALASLELALQLALDGMADALCTAPIDKGAMAAIGFSYPGHTEMLADRSGTDSFAMLLEGGGLRVVPATIHEPLKRVPSLLDRKKLSGLLDLIATSMGDFGIERPRIGVAGLNPHAGEQGLLGGEDMEIIAPAVQDAAGRGLAVSGPFAADTIFHRALTGEFDVVLAMYHDQALIPIKTLDFHGGINVTLGLPFVRTSPDHGTAYDLAGQGRARPDSLLAALRRAEQLARRRLARRAAAPQAP